ncbi:MAG: hypothetical protein QM665_00340 [Desulfovibrio sp.]
MRVQPLQNILRRPMPLTAGLAARLPLLAVLVAALVVGLCLAACTKHSGTATSLRREQPAGSASLLPRADPGYLQWLERQSMLGSTQELTGQVSGTDLIWRNSASARRVPLLLTAAPNWFDVNPHSLGAGQPALRALAQPGVDAFWTQADLAGCFWLLWAKRATSGAPTPHPHCRCRI